MPYRAPLAEYKFLLAHVVGFARVAGTARFAEADTDTVGAILNEAGKLCEGVLAPLQRAGDLHPARLENGVLRSPPGFAGGWQAIAEGGWIGMSGDPERGGMGLPMTLTAIVNEMMSAACLSLQLAPLMSQGQLEALEHHASETLKDLYMPKLMRGEWAGTMNLTEPQAGSDVGALSSRAVDNGDGTFAITGQKIFITWGDNDFTSNVCHLVLARLPDGAPDKRPGTKGISLFLVPKFLPDENGDPGVANTLKVVSLEHKLGLHGSPTCVMDYDGATGWLVGHEHGGMAAMFTMMNNARLGVGGEGVGVAEAACQQAMDFAQERRQGHSASGTIIDHADVRRMLTGMKADVFAARALLLACAVATDMGEATGEADWKARAAFLTPISKVFGSETGMAVSETGVQVHGGMGVIEETGAAQYYRDVRVTAIYEGTNGIQAMDLVGRKMMDGGDAACHLMDEIEAQAEAARARHPTMAEAVWQANESLRETTEWLISQPDMNDRFAGAVPYLRAFARVLGGHFHLAAALGDPGNPGGARQKLARFYITRMLPEHAGLLAHAQAGAAGLYDLSIGDLAG